MRKGALDDICDLVTDGTHGSPERTESGIPVLSAQHVNHGTLSFETNRFTSEEEWRAFSRRVRPRAGDVLLTIVGSIGRAALVADDRPVVFQRSVAILRPRPSICDARYLKAAIEAQEFAEQLARATNQSSQAGVYLGKLGRLDVPLPPLAEQRRIAEVLDRAETLRAQRRQVLAQLDALAEAIFLDMFGDQVVGTAKWPAERLGSVATFFAGNSLPEGVVFNGQPDGFFCAKVSDMNSPGNEVVLRSCQVWSPVPGAKSATCPVGTVILPKRGGAISTNKKRLSARPTVLDPNLMGIRGDPKVLNLTFLFHWFLRFDLSSISSGSSVPQLNKQDLEPLPISVPPIAEQDAFASRIACLDQLKRVQQAGLAHLNTLFTSLQHRAFRGEL